MNTSYIENPIFFLSKHHNFDESEGNMKTLKSEREKNQWRDLNKKHDVVVA